MKYLKNIVNNVPINEDEWSPPLIDVWANYDTFILQVYFNHPSFFYIFINNNNYYKACK